MSVNLIQLEVSDEQVATAVAALDQLETALAGLVSLSPDDRRRLTKMGPKSEVFCRQALSVLEQNRQIVPPSLDLPGAQLDLRTLDRLRPLLDRLQRLAERGEDTETALGADLMAFALEGYGLLKVSGKNQGLDGLRKEMGARWAKGRREAAAPPA
ncbi:Methyl-accepting chemotaxis protein [Lysobacter capsici AZ78]|uniref:Methyl-accepting chemotaxis protein n=1 Tax=Lysobacter capsici AZ78 TaxID=1444315 RepID=A0A108U4K4_9GAMM|nr:hypothetical protein [Lysobacter capsici]KWS02455.1 Methyl-accepting chemotaxis protein [Lysobacter capsici AZ78]